MLFEDVASSVVTIVATALPGWLAILTNMITDVITAGAPVGNNGLVQSPFCKQCQPFEAFCRTWGGTLLKRK